MDFSGALASHLMLDPTSNGFNTPEDHQQTHRRHSSTASSSTFSAASYDSLNFDQQGIQSGLMQGQEGDFAVPTRTSARLHKPSSASPPHAFPLGRPSHHAPSPSQQPYLHQSRSHASLVSQDSVGGFQTSLHQAFPYGTQVPAANTYGVQKRTPSTRRARADSSPYPSQPPFQGSFESGSNSQEFSEYLSPHGAGTFHGGEMDNWSDTVSRRSSMSPSGWSSYDPAASNPALSLASPDQYDESYIDNSVMPSLFSQGQLGHLGVVSGDGAISDSGGSSVEDTRLALERFASNVKNAVTSSAQDRARGAFVQAWLGLSYHVYPEGNVSRQGLYGSYLKSCTMHGVKAINSASFGKAVRQKYPDIKTRRLGVRGASRYHYTGIRPANAAEAAILAQLAREESENNLANIQSTRAGSTDGSSTSPAECSNSVSDSSEAEDDPSHRLGAPSFYSEAQPATPTTARPAMPSNNESKPSVTAHHRNTSAKSKSLSISVPRGSYVGGEKTAVAPASVPHQPLVGFPPIEDAIAVAGPGIDRSFAFEFWQRYASHCQTLLESVRAHRFDQFELGVRSWWTSLDGPQMALVQVPAISQLVYRADAAVYNDVLEFLHAQILVNMPPQVFASLRGLADNMEKIKTIALAGFEGQAFPGPKVELAARFGHLVTRHLGLCQLAQALTGIVSNPANLREMADAWDQIDFEAIKNQSALVSNCEHSALEENFDGFREILKNPGQVPIDSFIRWADQCLERCIAPPTSTSHRQTSPRSLLIRWSFVTSQVMRDLTLRSAPTFGSFAIASTFFDEFLSFQVLRRVALQISAIAPTVESPKQSFPGEIQPSNGAYTTSVTTITTTDTLYPHATSSTDALMKDHLSTLDNFALAQVGQYPSEYSSTLQSPHAQFGDGSRPFGAGPHVTDYGGGHYGQVPSGYAMTANSPQDHFARMDAEVERFGDLRFDSSPSTSASSPEN